MAGKSRESRIRTLTYVAGSHKFEITGPIRPTANQLCSIFDVENALAMIPTAIIERSYVSKISVLDTPNNADKLWKERTKNSNFCSFATANSETFEIELYKNRDSSWMSGDDHLQILAKKICHELGHLIDTVYGKTYGFTYLGFSRMPIWRDAVTADGLKENNGFLTAYAASHANNSTDSAFCEDFAESIGYFFCLPKWNRWMQIVAPHRVAVIRQLFHIETETVIRKFATA